MLRFFDILKKIKTSVKFEKNSRNTEVPKGKFSLGSLPRNGKDPFRPLSQSFARRNFPWKKTFPASFPSLRCILETMIAMRKRGGSRLGLLPPFPDKNTSQVVRCYIYLVRKYMWVITARSAKKQKCIGSVSLLSRESSSSLFSPRFPAEGIAAQVQKWPHARRDSPPHRHRRQK